MEGRPTPSQARPAEPWPVHRRVGAAAVRALVAGWVAVVTLAAAAAAGSPEPAAAIPAVVSVAADLDSFNEYVATSTFAADVADQLFLTLREERPAPPGGLPGFLPRLERSWEVAPDGLSVTFRLHDDVRWSNGRPTTAEDVVFTWRAQVDEGLGWAGADLKEAIASVVAADPRTVAFTMKRPGPYTLLDINEGHVLPAHALASVPPAAWRTTDFSRAWSPTAPSAWPPGSRARRSSWRATPTTTSRPGTDFSGSSSASCPIRRCGSSSF